MRSSAFTNSPASNQEGNHSPNGSGKVASPHPPSDQAGADVRVEPEREKRNLIVENARREFTSAFGDLAKGKRNWQVISFVLSTVLALQGFAMVRLASSAHAIPYLVQVDRFGTVASVGAAEPMRDPDAPLVASQLADFIRSVRTILPSIASSAQADVLRRAYAFTAPQTAAFLNSYFGDASRDPRLLGQRLTRDVQITGALRLPDGDATRKTAVSRSQTWRLQWIETDRPTVPGDSARVAAWEGYVTLQIIPPRTADVIQVNPLGLRITSITWTRVAGRPLPGPLDSLNSTSQFGGER
jgi:type IV secretion system protein TrbF